MYGNITIFTLAEFTNPSPDGTTDHNISSIPLSISVNASETKI